MNDLITGAVENIDRQLVRLALEMAGDGPAANRLLQAVAEGRRDPKTDAYVASCGALLKARRALASALLEAEPEPAQMEIDAKVVPFPRPAAAAPVAEAAGARRSRFARVGPMVAFECHPRADGRVAAAIAAD